MIIKLNKKYINDIYRIESSNPNPLTINMIKDSMKNENYHFFGYMNKNILIGYYYIRIIMEICELFKITVHKNNQNLGVGKILLDHCINYSRNKNCRFIELEVRENNVKAKLLYLKKNFRIISIRKNYYNNPTEDAILMTLNL